MQVFKNCKVIFGLFRGIISRMLKSGKYKKVKNIIGGWALQGIHALDKGERNFRILLEILIIFLIFFLVKVKFTFISFTLVFIICHTLLWLLDSAFWVYMLLSFDKITNPGIHKLVQYADMIKNLLYKYVDVLVIYGSVARREFHKKSDLDVIAVRRKDTYIGLISYLMALLVRAYAFFYMYPVSLYILENIDELQKRIRQDEKPIIVFSRKKIPCNENEINFEKLKKEPNIAIKNANI